MFSKIKSLVPIMMTLVIGLLAPMGTAWAGSATLSPTNVDFGMVDVGNSPMMNIVVTHDGGQPFDFNNPAATISGDTDYMIDSTDCDGATLNGGATCTVVVTFTPSSAGVKNATVTFDPDPADTLNPSTMVSVTGEGVVNPEATIDPTTHDFGMVPLNTASAMQTFTVESITSADLIIGSVTLGGSDPGQFTIDSDACSSATLMMAETCEIQVSCTPDTAGAQSAILEVPSNDPNTPTTATLDCEGVTAPVVDLNPTSVDFGPILNGTTDSTTVTITNTGTGDLDVGTLAVSGTDAAFFDVPGGSDNCSGQTVSANGGTCTFDVSFSPLAPSASYSAQVDIPSNALSDPDVLPLAGQGFADDEPLVGLNPTSLDFGNVGVGSASGLELITVTNIGGSTSTLNISSVGITDSGNFSIDSTDCDGAALTQGQSCTANLIFTPQAEGVANGSFDVTSDAASSPDLAPLTGTGVSASGPVASVDPTTLDFGNLDVNTSASGTVTVTNTGNADLVLGAASLGGTNPGVFSIAQDNCSGQTLSSGANCTFTIAVVGSGAGQVTATLNIPSNDPLSPATVALLANFLISFAGGGCSLGAGVSFAGGGHTLWLLAFGGIAWFRFRRKRH